MDEVYVLEWSHKQGMPHVQRLNDTLSANRRAYTGDKPSNDYIPLAVGTLDDMLTAAEAMRPTLIKRRPEKAEILSL